MLYLQLSIGPLFLLLSILYRVFPPKKINYIYGYRTKRSMQTQEAWDYGNKVSANLFLIVAVTTCILQLSLMTFFDDKTVIMISSVWLVTSILASIAITELYLKKKFTHLE